MRTIVFFMIFLAGNINCFGQIGIEKNHWITSISIDTYLGFSKPDDLFKIITFQNFDKSTLILHNGAGTSIKYYRFIKTGEKSSIPIFISSGVHFFNDKEQKKYWSSNLMFGSNFLSLGPVLFSAEVGARYFFNEPVAYNKLNLEYGGGLQFTTPLGIPNLATEIQVKYKRIGLENFVFANIELPLFWKDNMNKGFIFKIFGT